MRSRRAEGFRFYGVRVRPQDDLDYSYLVVAYHTLQNATVPVVGSDGAMSPYSLHGRDVETGNFNY